MSNRKPMTPAGVKLLNELQYALKCYTTEEGTTQDQNILLFKHRIINECSMHSADYAYWAHVFRDEKDVITVWDLDVCRAIRKQGIKSIALEQDAGTAIIPPVSAEDELKERLYKEVNYSALCGLPKWVHDAVLAEFIRRESACLES